MSKVTRIVALSGSLRRLSINGALLREMEALAPAGVTVEIVSPGTLPLFNPDLETNLPGAVAGFRKRLLAADALIIASPEYAHGISSVIKNALDWLVSCEDFAGKPVAVLNAAPRAHHADAALREILSTMAARIVEDASITVRTVNNAPSTAEMFPSPVRETLTTALAALVAATCRPEAGRMNSGPCHAGTAEPSGQPASVNKGTGQ